MIFKNFIRTLYKFGRSEIFENIIPPKCEMYFEALLKSKKQTFYLGIDPTSNSLQIGNMFPLLALLRMWSNGHNIIIVVGGATGQIGDPTGRVTDRIELQQTTVISNVATISKDIEKIVNNYRSNLVDGTQIGSFRLLNNVQWYQQQNILSFLSEVLKYFKFNDVKNKRSFEDRLSSKNSVNMKEFFYPFLQAYDWLHLYREYDCQVQIGGDDQQGNMQLGQILIEKAERKKVYGLTVPLFAIDGEKIGKSSARSRFNVHLNAEAQSPFSLFCTLMHMPNTMILNNGLLKRLTVLQDDEIESILCQHREDAKRQSLQHALAEQVVRLVHGGDVLEAVKCTFELFSPVCKDSFDRSLGRVNDSSTFMHHIDSVPHLSLGPSGRDVTICDLVALTESSSNNSNSVIQFNGQIVTDLQSSLSKWSAQTPVCGILQIGSSGKWLVVHKT